MPDSEQYAAAALGSSAMAKKLRAAIAAAASDPARRPVLLSGEPGLRKEHLAALIHYSSPNRELPLVKIDCQATQDIAAVLFGPDGSEADGSSSGLLCSLAATGGTLLLNNVHVVPPGPLRDRLRTLVAGCNDAAAVAGRSHPRLRILLTSERPGDDLEQGATIIKVPPLRARPADIKELAAHFLAAHASRAGGSSLGMHIAPPALRRLLSYQFPVNIVELEAVVERVAIQAPTGPTGAEPLELSNEDFWFATQEKDRCRINLLDCFPAFREGLRSGVWPEGLNRHVTPYAFAALLAMLFFGPQDRAHSIGLIAVWAWWWPGMFALYPLVGRLWCSVCPFMVVGELAQGARQAAIPGPLIKWPRREAEQYGPWFLVALFAGILVWEEVFRLPDTAYLTGWLLVLITSGAVVCGSLFPKRFWCRFLCPIGGMNGLFAKLSVTELRSQAGVCSSECTTYHCLKGRPASEETHATAGCPMGQHSNQLTDNSICSMCSQCVAMCPHDSVEVRLRPPGVDLWTSQEATAGETALLLLLMGAVVLHRMPHLLLLAGADPSLLHSSSAPVACGLSLLVLTAPGALVWGAHTAAIKAGSLPGRGSLGSSESASAAAKPAPSFLKLSLAYVPLVWAATLAYHGQFLLTEAGLVGQVGAASLGMAADTAPGLAAHPAVVSFLQGSLMLLGSSCSLALLYALTSRGGRSVGHAGAHAAIMAAVAAGLWLLID
ncbi:hypothetical protein ABPG77_001511 [Micractinium sp. CCAP 211/92]